MTEAEREARRDRAIALRKAFDLTQEQLAEAAGLERTYITKIETGNNLATSAEIQRGYATALAVGVEALADYLDGQITLEELRHAAAAGSTAHFELDPQRPNLSAAIKAFPISHGHLHTPAEISGACAELSSAQFKNVPDQTVEAWTGFLVSIAQRLRAERKGKAVAARVDPPTADPPLKQRIAAAKAKQKQ